MLKRRLEFAGLANKGLHQTRRGGVALRSPGPVVEARLAGEGRCCTGLSGGKCPR